MFKDALTDCIECVRIKDILKLNIMIDMRSIGKIRLFAIGIGSAPNVGS